MANLPSPHYNAPRPKQREGEMERQARRETILTKLTFDLESFGASNLPILTSPIPEEFSADQVRNALCVNASIIYFHIKQHDGKIVITTPSAQTVACLQDAGVKISSEVAQLGMNIGRSYD